MEKRSLSAFVSMVLVAGLLTTACGTSKPTTADSTGSSSSASQKKIVAKFSHVVTDTTPKGVAANMFADLVAKKSDGRMEIKIYPTGQLYGDKDEIDALKANNVQIIAPSAGKLISLDPAFQVADIPFLLGSFKAMRTFFDGEGGAKLNNRLDSHGMTILNWWNNSFRHFTDKKVQIKLPSDMAGKKYRISTGGVATDIYKAVGATGVVIATGDLYTSLQQGLVDGTFASIDNIITQKQEEVVKYLTLSYVNSINYPIIVNKQWWDSVPADLQKVFLDCLKEATDFEWQKSEELDVKAMENLKKAGMKIHELNAQERAAFQKALKPVVEKYEGIIGKELVDVARKVDAANTK